MKVMPVAGYGLHFYTNPQRLKPPVPYIMPNILQSFDWQKWLDNDWCKHVILDSAVESIFMIRKLKDYPVWYWKKFGEEVRKAKNKPDVWVTIPDYPDDYGPGMTHEKGLDNVDKTFLNIEKYINIPGVNWLPVIQSTFLNRKRFTEACQLMQKYKPEQVGIGTVCKTNDLKFIHYCLRKARKYFPGLWIHAFGLTLRAVPFARHYIQSGDSSSHVTWLRWERRERGWNNAPNITTLAYDAFQKRAEELKNLPSLENYK